MRTGDSDRNSGLSSAWLLAVGKTGGAAGTPPRRRDMGEEDDVAPSNPATSAMPVVLRAVEDKNINRRMKEMFWLELLPKGNAALSVNSLAPFYT